MNLETDSQTPSPEFEARLFDVLVAHQQQLGRVSAPTTSAPTTSASTTSARTTLASSTFASSTFASSTFAPTAPTTLRETTTPAVALASTPRESTPRASTPLASTPREPSRSPRTESGAAAIGLAALAVVAAFLVPLPSLERGVGPTTMPGKLGSALPSSTPQVPEERARPAPANVVSSSASPAPAPSSVSPSPSPAPPETIAKASPPPPALEATPPGPTPAATPAVASVPAPRPLAPEVLEATGDDPLAKTLVDGSVLFLDRGARAVVLGERRVRLERGRALLEVAPGPSPFTTESPSGEAIAHGTKFLLDADAAGLSVTVAQGVVELRGAQGAPVFLKAGEAGHAAPGEAPVAGASARLSHVAAWVRDVYERRSRGPRTLGSRSSVASLDAVDPALGRTASLDVRALEVDVHIEDGVARTTLDTTFWNPSSLRLEGSYHFPVPPGASISRLAMYVDGKLMEGGVAERERARDVFESIEHQRRDPALLEWLEGNVFKMRIFPIEPLSEKRVIVSFTQTLDSLEGTLRYALPLEAPAACGRFGIQVRVQGGAATPFDAPTYAFEPERTGGDLVLRYLRTDFRPRRDLVLSLDDPSRPENAASIATCGEEGRGHYVHLRVRPTFPAPVLHGEHAPRHLAVVLDAGASVGTRERAVQSEVLERLLAELDDRDLVRFSVVNTRVQAWPLGWRPARDPATTRSALAFVGSVRAIGATNLGVAFVEAAAALEQQEGAHLVYVGSGLATIGEREPAALAALVPPGVPFVGIGLGKRTDTRTLETLAGATGGLTTLLDLDEPVSWRLFDLVAALGTPRISGLTARGVVVKGEPAHGELVVERPVVALGEEIRVLGRYEGRLPDRIVLEGQLAGARWSTTVVLEGAREGALYLPRLWARGRVESLIRLGAQAHHDEIVALGTRYFLATPFTSLLVLENDAQYQQYHVVRGHVDPFATYPAPEFLPSVPVKAEQAAREEIAAACARGQAWPSEGELLRSVVGLGSTSDADATEWPANSGGPSSRAYNDAIRIYEGAATSAANLSPGSPPLANFDINGNVGATLAGTGLPQQSSGGSFNQRARPANLFIGPPQTPSVAGIYRKSTTRMHAHDYFYKKYESPNAGESETESSLNPNSNMLSNVDEEGEIENVSPTPLGSLPFTFGTGLDPFDTRNDQLVRGGGAAGNELGVEELRRRWNHLSDAAKTLGPVIGGIPFFGSTYLRGRLQNVLDGGDGYFGGDRGNGLSIAGASLPMAESATGPEAAAFDLVRFAPGLEATWSDLAALVERDLPSRRAQITAGVHEPEALARLERARAAFGRRSFSLDGPESRLEGTVSGDGQLDARTLLPNGLEERVVASATSIDRVYAELGLAAHRPRSRYHESDLGLAVPFLLPAAGSLEACDVRCVGERGVSIAFSHAGDEGEPVVRTELVFSAEHELLERRLVSTADGSVIVRFVFERGVLRVEATGQSPRVQPLTFAPVSAAAFPVGDTPGVLSLDVPARSVAYSRARVLLAGTPTLRAHALAQLAFSQVFEREAEPEGARNLLASDHHPGGFVLQAAAHAKLDQDVLTQARWELGGSRVLDYLAALALPEPEERLEKLRAIGRAALSGLIPDLARFGAARIAFDRAAEPLRDSSGNFAPDVTVTASRLKRALELSFAFAERTDDGPLVLALALRAVQLQLPLSTDVDSVVALLEIAARTPALALRARLDAVFLLSSVGRADEAMDRADALCARLMAAGELPPLGSGLRDLFWRAGATGPRRYYALLERALEWASRRADADADALLTIASDTAASGDVAVAAEALRRLPRQLSPRAASRLRALVSPIGRPQTSTVGLGALEPATASELVQGLLARPELAREIWLQDVVAARAQGRLEWAAAAAGFGRALGLQREARLAGRSDVLPWTPAWYANVASVLGSLARARRTAGSPVDAELVARILATWDEASARGLAEGPFVIEAAAALLDCGDDDDAWDAASTAIERHPDEASSHSSVAVLYLARGRLEVAAQSYARAAAAEPTDPSILLAEARVLLREGETAGGRALLEKVLGGTWQERFAPVVNEARTALAASEVHCEPR